jgi:hypothetical protein
VEALQDDFQGGRRQQSSMLSSLASFSINGTQSIRLSCTPGVGIRQPLIDQTHSRWCRLSATSDRPRPVLRLPHECTRGGVTCGQRTRSSIDSERGQQCPSAFALPAQGACKFSKSKFRVRWRTVQALAPFGIGSSLLGALQQRVSLPAVLPCRAARTTESWRSFQLGWIMNKSPKSWDVLVAS